MESANLELLKSAIYCAPVNIFFKDTECKYRFVSEICEAVNVVGENGTILGKTDVEIQRNSELGRFYYEDDKKILATGEGSEYISEFPTEDGKTLYFEIKKSAVRDDNNKIIGIVGMIADVTKRVLLEKEEEKKLIFSVDEVMKNTALLDHIRSEKELEEVMPVLLAPLGKYAKASYSYIYEEKPGTKGEFHLTHIWSAKNDFQAFQEIRDISVPSVPNWFSALNEDGSVVIYDWEMEKEKYPEEYRLFSGQGLHSIIILPLITGGVITGYIGIDNPGHNRIAMTASLLKGISGHISSLKENLHMMKTLEENQLTLEDSLKELQREKSILDALSVDYTSVYYCDLLQDTFIPIKCAEYNNASATVKEMAEKSGSYSTTIRYYFDHFVIPESAPDFLEKLDAENLKEYLSKNERFAYRYRVNPNKIGQQYFEIQVVRLPDADGFKAIMGYRYLDDLVAEQERLQTSLEDALAEATFNSDIVGTISKIYWLIYLVDLTDQTYEEISAAQETHKLTGKKGYIADILQEMFDKIVSDEHLSMMHDFWNIPNIAKRLKETDSIAIEYKTRTGAWNQARIIAKKRDNAGNVLNALYAVRRIDQEKKKEIEYNQRLQEIAEDARRANLAKTDFLRRMSHDIRTPINGIQGMIAIAEHFSNDLDKQQECREKVKEASGFLLDLANNVLDMNKLESGAIVLEHKPFNLLDVLGEINNIARMNAGLHGIKVMVNNSKIKHVHLVGSPLHLKQILQNIDSNAIKYNRENGSISCSAAEIFCDKGIVTYQFVCSDTGRGMSKEFLSHAFEPFAQEDNSTRTAYMGTGLGLPIAKQLIEMMGGTIRVESKKNVGTTFTMTIPFKMDTEYKKRDLPEKMVSDMDISGARVLLVEDNELNMEIAKFMLENAGMHVMTASNGQEAVDTFSASEENQIDLILMDIMMPVMDGLTAARTIRSMARKDAGTVPIFAMTANAFSDDIKASYQAGINEHLSKPLDKEKMMNVIKRYLCR